MSVCSQRKGKEWKVSIPFKTENQEGEILQGTSKKRHTFQEGKIMNNLSRRKITSRFVVPPPI